MNEQPGCGVDQTCNECGGEMVPSTAVGYVVCENNCGVREKRPVHTQEEET